VSSPPAHGSAGRRSACSEHVLEDSECFRGSNPSESGWRRSPKLSQAPEDELDPLEADAEVVTMKCRAEGEACRRTRH
jgi:hypothetical protein